MGRKSRTKGKVGEREARDEINRLFPFAEAYRTSQYCGKAGDSDVTAPGLPGIHLEVKRTESLSLYTAIEQAVADCGDSLPVVLHRRSRKPWLAVIRLDDLPELVQRIYLAAAGQ